MLILSGDVIHDIKDAKAKWIVVNDNIYFQENNCYKKYNKKEDLIIIDFLRGKIATRNGLYTEITSFDKSIQPIGVINGPTVIKMENQNIVLAKDKVNWIGPNSKEIIIILPNGNMISGNLNKDVISNLNIQHSNPYLIPSDNKVIIYTPSNSQPSNNSQYSQPQSSQSPNNSQYSQLPNNSQYSQPQSSQPPNNSQYSQLPNNSQNSQFPNYVQPQSSQPQSYDQLPNYVQPQSSQPQSYNSQSFQPQSFQPQSFQPQSYDQLPNYVQPQSSQPQSSQPQSSQPQSSQPQSSQPQSYDQLPNYVQPQSSQPQSYDQLPNYTQPQSSQPQSYNSQSFQPQSYDQLPNYPLSQYNQLPNSQSGSISQFENTFQNFGYDKPTSSKCRGVNCGDVNSRNIQNFSNPGYNQELKIT